ncbi:hypothetical protein D3C86_284110 [compost metagenome]
MREASRNTISRVVRTEVGTLAGASDAVIVRVEHLPLADAHPDEKAGVMVFILDQAQAANLEGQLVSSFNLLASKPFGVGH